MSMTVSSISLRIIPSSVILIKRCSSVLENLPYLCSSSWTIINHRNQCLGSSNKTSQVGSSYIPLTIQAREMNRKTGDSHARSRKLTIKPKALISHPKSMKKSKDRSIVSNHQIESNPDYYDDIDLSHDDYEEFSETVSIYGDRLRGIKDDKDYWRNLFQSGMEMRHWCGDLKISCCWQGLDIPDAVKLDAPLYFREALAYQRLVRARTLEHKYFKPPKNLNILTWAAKEQIRFLHESDPEEWTIEYLSKIFPVGKQSIQKILKSKIRLRRAQDILQNDLHVRKNWEMILSHLRKNQLDSDNSVKDFLENLDTIEIIQNALPSSDLPSPKLSQKPNKGTFSLIVSDELDRQREANDNILAEQKQLDTMVSEILSEVKDIITEAVKSDHEKTQHKKNFSPQNSQETLRALIRSRFQDNNFSEDYSKDSDDNTVVETVRHNEAPRKITMPNQKNDQPKMYSYRVDDCVYDDNGEFLYRLPSSSP